MGLFLQHQNPFKDVSRHSHVDFTPEAEKQQSPQWNVHRGHVLNSQKLSATLSANTSNFCRALVTPLQTLHPSVTVFQNSSSAQLLPSSFSFYVNPQRLGGCSFPKYPARTFLQHLPHEMHEWKASCMENLINFAPSIITVDCIPSVEHVSQQAWSKRMTFDILTVRRAFWETDVASSKTILKFFFFH